MLLTVNKKDEILQRLLINIASVVVRMQLFSKGIIFSLKSLKICLKEFFSLLLLTLSMQVMASSMLKIDGF